MPDNGIGIPPELLPHVFDLFVQGGSAGSLAGRPRPRADDRAPPGGAARRDVAAERGPAGAASSWSACPSAYRSGPGDATMDPRVALQASPYPPRRGRRQRTKGSAEVPAVLRPPSCRWLAMARRASSLRSPTVP